jgi:hypothetical protein
VAGKRCSVSQVSGELSAGTMIAQHDTVADGKDVDLYRHGTVTHR